MNHLLFFVTSLPCPLMRPLATPSPSSCIFPVRCQFLFILRQVYPSLHSRHSVSQREPPSPYLVWATRYSWESRKAVCVSPNLQASERVHGDPHGFPAPTSTKGRSTFFHCNSLLSSFLQLWAILLTDGRFTSQFSDVHYERDTWQNGLKCWIWFRSSNIWGVHKHTLSYIKPFQVHCVSFLPPKGLWEGSEGSDPCPG